MSRASRCRQRPSVVRAGRLGLLPKVAAVGLGLGWSNCGPVPAQATWTTMQVCDSERGQHALTPPCAALRRIHRHRCRAGGKRTPESGRTEACRWPHSLHTAEAPHLPARRPQLLAGQPIIATTLVQVACLTKPASSARTPLAPYSATVGLIVEPRLGSYPHSAVQVLASTKGSCIQLVASRPVRWSGPRAPARSVRP
jgi:hypothetical protein